MFNQISSTIRAVSTSQRQFLQFWLGFSFINIPFFGSASKQACLCLLYVAYNNLIMLKCNFTLVKKVFGVLKVILEVKNLQKK